MPLSRLFPLLILVALAACSSDRDDSTAPEMQDTSLSGVFSGSFPCQDCPAITATLWLKPDSRFFFEQRYSADEAGAATAAYSLGRWRQIDGRRAIELTGTGPKRLFTLVDTDTLLMQTDTDLEHRLTRDPAAPEFRATIRMTGMMRARGDTSTFAECLTGLSVPVREGRELGRFRHQYRSVARRGAPVLAELEGRFTWSANGTPKLLVIERFNTVKPDGAC